MQICPVGALTAKPYRFRARPWDLEQVESTCTTCSVGCRITVQSSQNQLRRYQGVDSDPVNWGWLCDKGRFAFEAVGSPDRVTAPLVRGEGDDLVPTSWAVALDAAAGALRSALDAGGPSSVAVIGGARGTNEDAFAWARLAREVIGTATSTPSSGTASTPRCSACPQATIDQACAAATIVLLGPDLKEELPVLYLRVRDAAEKRRSRVLELSPKDTGLTRYAWRSVRYEPGQQASVARTLLAEAEVAEQLAGGDVVVIVGRANLAEPEHWTRQALSEVVAASPGVRVPPGAPAGQRAGRTLCGRAVAGRGRASTPGASSRPRPAVASGAWSSWVPTLSSTSPTPTLARRALAGAATVLAVDTHRTSSSGLAQVLLPAAAFAEKSGTTTNLEGRVTALSQKVTPPGIVRPDWVIAADLADALGTDLGVDRIEQLHDQLVATVPAFAPASASALAAERDGVLLAATESSGAVTGDVAAPPVRSSYDLRLVVSRSLYDAGVAVATSPSLAPLAPGGRLHIHPLDLDRLGATTGTSLKVSSAGTTLVVEVEADAGVARGTAWLPFNQPGSTAADLLDSAAGAIDLRVENLT